MKWRFFRYLRHGGDEDAEALYRWHIQQRSGHRIALGVVTDKWKRSIDDYVRSARGLFYSMREFGAVLERVPIDLDNELLDGSHRVACAVALDIETIPVVRYPRHVWAPAWDEAWFAARMTEEGVARLLVDFKAMTA